ncbi:MAG TPA: hypothetical protein VMV33_17075 [Rhodocyclaceae bacterium]|nr:hypothetical protein [Rhodocyclaceae bacterium]
MSGSIEGLIANPQGVDVLSQLGQWQGLHQGRAQTEQTQAQTQGIGLQNELQRLQVARTGYLYGLAGVPGVGGAAGAPGGQPAGGAPLAAGPGAGVPGVGAGAAPGAAPAGAAPGAPTATSYPGETGVRMFGVPMPPFVASSVLMAKDPQAALKDALESRRQAVFSAINVPPEQFPQAVREVLAAGFITPEWATMALRNPAIQQRLLQSFQSPDAYQSTVTALSGQGLQRDPTTGAVTLSPVALQAKGLGAQAEAGGRAAGALPYVAPTAAAQASGAGRYETTTVTVPDPDRPGSFRTDTVLKSSLPGILDAGGRTATLADRLDPSLSIGPAAWAERVRGRENGGGAPDARNPRSSALGDGQFTEATWKETVAAAQPPWAAGMSESELLAARKNPQYAAQMNYAQAQMNGPKLQAAGMPVTTMTLGLAHQLGAAGATRVMSAAPGTPLRDVLPAEVIKANPQFARMTTDQLAGQALQVYGVNQIDLSKPVDQAFHATPSGPGALPGPPKLTPQQTAGLEVTQQAIGNDQKVADTAIGAARGAQAAQTQLLQLRSLAPQISTGSYADARQNVQNYLATFAPEFAQKFVSAVTAGKIDPSKAGATQEFVKIALQQAGQAERSVLGANGGVSAIELYQKAFPNIGMQPTAIKDMTNLLLVAHQRDVDYGEGANGYFDTNRDAFREGGKYKSLRTFDEKFVKENPPQVYVGAAAAVNQHPYAEWSKGLTPAQQTHALQVMWRADPTSAAYGPDGKLYHAPPAAGGG